MKFHKEIIFLGDIVNYSLKGLTAALGKGEGITKFVRPIPCHIDMDSKLSDLIGATVATNLLRNGDVKKGIGVRYPKDPNFSCYMIAKNIREKLKVKVDVVISDSDSGGTKGIALIGCPTIIATPIGATKGLRLFYCMRVAVAAEATWNNIENTPILLVQPPQNYAVRIRKNIGELRYRGFLNAKREKDVISILKKK